MNIADHQTWEGFCKSVSNARELRNSSKILADAGQYGHALSMSILSIEESMKAIGLLDSFAKVSELETDLSKYFKSHKFKQSNAHSLFMLKYMFDDFISEMLAIESDSSIRKEDYSSTLVKRVTGKINSWIDRGHKPLDEMKAWYDGAERLKQQGFYIDFIQGKWSDPNQFGKEDFSTSMNYANAMVEFLEPLTDKNTATEHLEQWKALVENVHANNQINQGQG